MKRLLLLHLTIILVLFQTTNMSAANSFSELEKYLANPEGWGKTGFRDTFTNDDLYRYINGGAERYLGYGFQRLLVQEYQSRDEKSAIRVEIYQMDRPSNAFGIFSSDNHGDRPDAVGAEAALGDYLLQFWQGPFFVRVQDIELSGALRETLLEFGRPISALLPSTKPDDLPTIISMLPEKGLIEQSVCYFHTQNSLNSFVYLGEENILGLGKDTEAVSAEYETGDKEPIALCILIKYPSQEQCRQALTSLEGSKDTLPENPGRELVYTSAKQKSLVLLFGTCKESWLKAFEKEL